MKSDTFDDINQNPVCMEHFNNRNETREEDINRNVVEEANQNSEDVINQNTVCQAHLSESINTNDFMVGRESIIDFALLRNAAESRTCVTSSSENIIDDIIHENDHTIIEQLDGNVSSFY